MQKLLTFFSAKILVYMPYLMIQVSFNDTLTNDIISFEQLGPGLFFFLVEKSLLSGAMYVLDIFSFPL